MCIDDADDIACRDTVNRLRSLSFDHAVRISFLAKWTFHLQLNDDSYFSEPSQRHDTAYQDRVMRVMWLVNLLMVIQVIGQNVSGCENNSTSESTPPPYDQDGEWSGVEWS